MLLLASIDLDSNNKKQFNILREIPESEMMELLGTFEWMHYLTRVRSHYDIVIQNGTELYDFIHPEKLAKSIASVSPQKIGITANRMVFNYTATLRCYLDLMERLLKEKQEEWFPKFKKYTSQLYDSHAEYRFLYNLRNFIIHYEMSFTTVTADVESGAHVYCQKHHLLKWSNWQAACLKDLKNGPDSFEIHNMVYKMNIYLTQLLMCYIAGWGKEIESTYNAFTSFCRKYEVHTPTFLETDSLDDLRQGKITMHPIPAGNLFDVIQYLKDNPFVRFKESSSTT